MNSKQIIIFINGTAGAQSLSDTTNLIKDSFTKFNVEPDIVLLNPDTNVSKKIQSLAKTENYTVVAAGGDGTINMVASALVDTGVPLGIIPVGTLNHFSKDNSLPQTIEAAVKVILNGATIKVDVGRVNDRIFLNNSSIGFYPRVVKHREQQQKTGRGKWFAMIVAAIKVFQSHPYLSLKLSLPEPKEIITPFVFIGNNEYEIEGLNLGSRETLTEGKLSVHIAHRTSRMRLLRLALHSVLGALKQQDDFDSYSLEHLEISSKKKFLQVAIDGEVVPLAMPLKYSLMQKALTIIVGK